MEFQTVITLVLIDAAPKVFGITGKLTEAQFQILYDAVGKNFHSPEYDRMEIMIGVCSYEGHGQHVEHILEADRMINLDDTNWPQYPVNTFTYIIG